MTSLEFIAEEWVSLLALVVAILAIWTRVRVPQRQRALEGYHHRIEKIAGEVEDRLYWEFTGEIPSTWEQHQGDFASQVHRRYIEGRRAYRRVRAYLSSDGRALVDRPLAEIEEILRTPGGRGTELLSRKGEFLNALAIALDVAAHPGMKLSEDDLPGSIHFKSEDD